MAQRFKGFPRDLPDFLWGVAFNNEKPWFEARRDVYERVLHRPMKALAAELTDALSEQQELSLNFHISRIYRDARLLRGRGPLNNHLWFSIGRTARVYEPEPQFYFEIQADRCLWGLGYWSVTGGDMELWRAAVDRRPERLLAIVRELRRRPDLTLQGGTYKRPKGDPGPELFDWYNARRVVIGREMIFDPDPPGPELFDRLLEDFTVLMPLYRYLSDFWADAGPEDGLYCT